MDSSKMTATDARQVTANAIISQTELHREKASEIVTVLLEGVLAAANRGQYQALITLDGIPESETCNFIVSDLYARGFVAALRGHAGPKCIYEISWEDR